MPRMVSWSFIDGSLRVIPWNIQAQVQKEETKSTLEKALMTDMNALRQYNEKTWPGVAHIMQSPHGPSMIIYFLTSSLVHY